MTFNEVLYHPADDDPDLEWIELRNQLAVLQDLGGWTLEGGISFRFPEGTRLTGEGFLLLAANPERFRAATGKTALGPFTGRLSNGGDKLVLRNASGRLMDELEYGDSPPWPWGADGSGASLAKRIDDSPSSPPGNWRASSVIGGTPGARNFPETARSMLATESGDGPAQSRNARTSSPVAAAAAAALDSGALVGFSEVSAGHRPDFFCELAFSGAAPNSVEGLRIRSSDGGEFRLPDGVMEPGAFRVYRTNELGFVVAPGTRLFLLGSDGRSFVDAVGLDRGDRARRVPATGEPFYRPEHRTPGAPNAVRLAESVVINELLYHAPPTHARAAGAGLPARGGTGVLAANATTGSFRENDEEWVELFNRSDSTADLSRWRLSGDFDFEFPEGTRMEAGSYLVVSREAAGVRAKYPGVRVLGDGSGRLGGRSGRVRLVDAAGNPADEVGYFDDAPWPWRADGGGSSLERIDPRADGQVPEAWAASDESRHSSWHAYRYRARAVTPVKAPAQSGFHEFRMGLLADGEALIDDLVVVEDPDGTARSLIQNGSFDDARAWRFLGNHSHTTIVDDPERPGNRVLRLVATDARGYMHNQLETTLKSGGAIVPVVAGRTYEISFRAKWMGGSPLLHTELYYNKVARTTVLEIPDRHGTPGARNTAYSTNAGPLFEGFFHEPLVPRPIDPVTVRVRIRDPDGVREARLFTSVNGGAWQVRPLSRSEDGSYRGTEPARPLNSVVQFHVEATDNRGAKAWFPPAGPRSRALYRVDTRQARAPRRAFRFVLTAADGRLLDAATNMMSDDRLGATVIWNDREVFYDCGVHLHGSMFSRNNLDATPYNMKFPADRKFRGVHRTVQLNRGTIEEILAKHAQVQAGIPGMYDDIVDLFSHRPGNSGAARMSLAHYNDIYLGSQYRDGADGLLYNMEGIRVLTTTHDRTREGIKLGMPADWVGDYDVMNLGDDPEQYRFSTTLRNNRARNDHAPYIAMAKAFSLSGTALERAIPDVIDVDQWMRYYAVLTLFGIGDTYSFGNPHNIGFYARPSDGRILALPYDWDFMFANGDAGPLWGNQNLGKIVARPVFTRLLYRHLHELVNGVFTTNYLGPFVADFGRVAGQNYASYLARIRGRGQIVRGRIPAAVPFEITSNGGTDFAVETGQVNLEGRGWIDVHEVRSGTGEVIPLQWVDATRWRSSLPLRPGPNRFELSALDRAGVKVGGDSIRIDFGEILVVTAGLDGRLVRLRFAGRAGRTYRVQARDGLVTGEWNDRGDPVRPLADGTVNWAEGVESGARFYRVRVD